MGVQPIVVLDVSWQAEPSIAFLDAILRVRLVAARSGHRLVVAGACPRLRGFLADCGFAEILPAALPDMQGVSGSPPPHEQPEQLRIE